ncbi:MAG TPA: hydroxymethylbilane synthase [Cryomorphaceae bacterium]|nr:hydroxymethylbilane synthase [Owenweeksia sp.]HAD98768.1 hydroxymethylbilane synthase [Cryomorphaceae bacterium]
MATSIRIGTRDSRLAVWQATQVQQQLERLGHATTLVYVKSPADIDLSTPLHQFGGTGIFTKVLDDALLNSEIDIAVHSLKDYPTLAPQGIRMAAVLERGPHEDILVYKGSPDIGLIEATIATGSIRRIAQWKNRYPHHTITGLRGNVQTRLKKLEENDWNGAVFAKAGLYRVEILPENHIVLDWMIPAPAQGVIGITCREEETPTVDILQQLNHEPTEITSGIERSFLRTLEGGCSAPIGALARINKGSVHFSGGLFAPDGSQKILVEKQVNISQAKDLGISAAREILQQGGSEIMENLANV